MPKILYIEDELTKNIATIKKFFSPVIEDKSILIALNELENSERPRPQNVIDALKPSPELELSYTLVDALEKIVTGHQSYDLIIIDRNLSIYDYSGHVEQVCTLLSSIGLEFSTERLFEYFEREGDLLLLVLLKLDRAAHEKVYYLTANTKDDLRGSELQTFVEMGSFQKEHIIEKGSDAEATISNILGDMKAFKIQNRFRPQCNALRSQLSEDDVKQFVDMVKYYDSDKRREFVFNLRNLLENVLLQLAKAFEEPNAPYWDMYNKKQLVVKKFIKGARDDIGNYWGMELYSKKTLNIGYNSIIQNACLSIYEISSDCVIHGRSKAIDIESLNTDSLSKHTMQSLLSQICDVIIWYDKAMGLIAKN